MSYFLSLPPLSLSTSFVVTTSNQLPDLSLLECHTHIEAPVMIVFCIQLWKALDIVDNRFGRHGGLL